VAASSAGASTGSPIPRMPAPASAGALGLQSPNQAPSPDQSQPQSAPSQPSSPPSQPQSVPSAPPPSSGGGGGVVSGGS
jgi:hypothetical protein